MEVRWFRGPSLDNLMDVEVQFYNLLPLSSGVFVPVVVDRMVWMWTADVTFLVASFFMALTLFLAFRP